MLIELTRNAGEFGSRSIPWFIDPEKIVAVSKSDRRGTIHDEAGVAVDNCIMTVIDVMGDGEHFVLEPLAEVRKKWEEAMKYADTYPDSWPKWLKENYKTAKVMLDKEGELLGWWDREGEFHERHPKDEGA